MDPLPRRLVAAASERPGACTRDLATAVGTSESNAAYHLKRLEREGAVLCEPSGRALSWYATGCGLCPVLRRAVPLLRREGVRAVAQTVKEAPETSRSLAARSGVDYGATRWAAELLEGAFLVERSSTGRVWLREGAARCVAMATTAQRCDLWGRCAVSRAFSDQRGGLDGFKGCCERRDGRPGHRGKGK